VIEVGGNADLVQVVATTHAIGSGSHFLHGRQEEPDENCNDGDNDKKLDQRKAGAKAHENISLLREYKRRDEALYLREYNGPRRPRQGSAVQICEREEEPRPLSSSRDELPLNGLPILRVQRAGAFSLVLPTGHYRMRCRDTEERGQL
jgi:hypothetical protein